MIHLDTCFLIRALVPGERADVELRRWLSAGEALGISAIAWAEFLCGPVRGDQAELAAQFVAEIASVGEEEAAVAARLFNASGRRRGTFVDCMIAAVALQHGASLATTNPDDFARFVPHGLVLAEYP